MRKHSIPAQYLILLLDLAQGRGCERQQLLAGSALQHTDLVAMPARVAERDFSIVADNALRLTGDPTLGLQLGLRLNLSAHAILGQAFMTCHNIGQVLELLQRYYHLLAPAIELEFGVDNGCCTLAVTDTVVETQPQFTFEMMFGATRNTLRGLLGREVQPLRVAFPYPAPPYRDYYDEVFGCEILFDATRGEIAFPLALLDEVLPSSNPALLSLYEQECQRLLADLVEEDAIAVQTLQLLRKLEGQYPKMPQLAQMLHLSPRTYRRRLDAEGHSFQTLLDQVRAEHATHYLQHSRLPLTSIAYQLGFTDTSNFRRAYLRWTGKTPTEVRHAGS